MQDNRNYYPKRKCIKYIDVPNVLLLFRSYDFTIYLTEQLLETFNQSKKTVPIYIVKKFDQKNSYLIAIISIMHNTIRDIYCSTVNISRPLITEAYISFVITSSLYPFLLPFIIHISVHRNEDKNLYVAALL